MGQECELLMNLDGNSLAEKPNIFFKKVYTSPP